MFENEHDPSSIKTKKKKRYFSIFSKFPLHLAVHEIKRDYILTNAVVRIFVSVHLDPG